MVATCLRKVGLGQQKPGKVSGTTRKQLEKHFVTNQVNWQQVSNMIRYKRSIRGAFSKAKVVRGSLCARVKAENQY